MSVGGIIRFSDIQKTASLYPEIKNGLLVDTSILFAASFPPDLFNTAAEQLFEFLNQLNIPVFTNVNIRAEFIDLHRRYMIPEGLVDLYTSGTPIHDFNIKRELKSVHAQASESRSTGRAVKFSDEKIKKWRSLLSKASVPGQDGWEQFCADFLQGKIDPIWDETCRLLNVSFISTRTGESGDWLTQDLTWEDMVGYVGRFGIGSSDAMVLNLFLNSKFAGLLTADRDLAYAVDRLKPAGKFVILPDGISI